MRAQTSAEDTPFPFEAAPNVHQHGCSFIVMFYSQRIEGECMEMGYKIMKLIPDFSCGLCRLLLPLHCLLEQGCHKKIA